MTYRNIGILAAIPEEIETLTHSEGTIKTTEKVFNREFTNLKFANHTLTYALSGCGKVAAATTAALMIERYKVDCVLFIGVAGSLSPNVKLGDVVIATELIQHDLDGRPLCNQYEIPYRKSSNFKSHTRLTQALLHSARNFISSLDNKDHSIRKFLSNIGLPSLPKVHEGLIVSGDQFISSHSQKKNILDGLPLALATEMEGAAVGQVCDDAEIPFVVIRTISDASDDIAHVSFQTFIEQIASKYGTGILNQYLTDLGV